MSHVRLKKRFERHSFKRMRGIPSPKNPDWKHCGRCGKGLPVLHIEGETQTRTVPEGTNVLVGNVIISIVCEGCKDACQNP